MDNDNINCELCALKTATYFAVIRNIDIELTHPNYIETVAYCNSHYKVIKSFEEKHIVFILKEITIDQYNKYKVLKIW